MWHVSGLYSDSRMRLMPANHSSSLIHYLAGKHPGKLGWLIGPRARLKTKLRSWMPYALDNDAFSAWTNKTEWSFENWIALLEWSKSSRIDPLWILVPDVVADRQATLDAWQKYSPHARKYGWPLAFAVQDGMSVHDVPEDAQVVFVGGTDEFKWSTVQMWAWYFPRVHVGRVNNAARLWQCEDLGVESADGTGWFRDPSDPTKLKSLIGWLEKKR